MNNTIENKIEKELYELNKRIETRPWFEIIKKGSHAIPKSEHDHNVAFVFDGNKYVIWIDRQRHPEDVYREVKNAKEFMDWLDHRYDADQIGTMRIKSGYGGVALPQRRLAPRIGPLGLDPRTLKLEFLSKKWLEAWENFQLV